MSTGIRKQLSQIQTGSVQGTTVQIKADTESGPMTKSKNYVDQGDVKEWKWVPTNQRKILRPGLPRKPG